MHISHYFPAFACTFIMLYHFLMILKKKRDLFSLKKIFDIYLKVKMGEKSIVILGHANHSSEVIISIHIEQVLYDENLKSYFPKISKKFKCQDLIRLQRIRAFIWITCLHGFLPSESAPDSQQHAHGTHQVAGCPLLSLPTTTCHLTRNPRSSTPPHHHFLQALPSSCWHLPWPHPTCTLAHLHRVWLYQGSSWWERNLN